MNDLTDINSKKIPNIIDITSLSIECTILAPKGANNIVTGTKIINPGKKFILKYTTVSGVEGFDGSLKKAEGSVVKSID